MANQRSPNCPPISFAEAAEKARRVYEREHTHAADKKVIAEDLGYSSISGASATTIGALRQYGLLEAAGDGLRISDDAVAFFELPNGDTERSLAIRRLAFRPPLFEELRSQFGDQIPSEANLRHILIKRGFLPKKADEVIHVYRENYRLVGAGDGEYNEAEASTMNPSQEITNPKKHVIALNKVLTPAQQLGTAAGHDSISTPVGKNEDGSVVFAHVSFDASIKKEFVAGLKKYLDYLEGTLA